MWNTLVLSFFIILYFLCSLSVYLYTNFYFFSGTYSAIYFMLIEPLLFYCGSFTWGSVCIASRAFFFGLCFRCLVVTRFHSHTVGPFLSFHIGEAFEYWQFMRYICLGRILPTPLFGCSFYDLPPLINRVPRFLIGIVHFVLTYKMRDCISFIASLSNLSY